MQSNPYYFFYISINPFSANEDVDTREFGWIGYP